MTVSHATRIGYLIGCKNPGACDDELVEALVESGDVGPDDMSAAFDAARRAQRAARLERLRNLR